MSNVDKIVDGKGKVIFKIKDLISRCSFCTSKDSCAQVGKEEFVLIDDAACANVRQVEAEQGLK